MSNSASLHQGRRTRYWRIIGWGGAVGLVLTPLVAMQFTSEIAWDRADFVAAAIMLGIVGALIEFAVRMSSDWYFRLGTLFAVLSGFLVVWINGAVGMIGNEVNPINLYFGAVLVIAIAGVILSRFYVKAMPVAMFAAGLCQSTVGLVAGIFGSDARGGMFTIFLAGFWFLAGLLFSKSGRKQT